MLILPIITLVLVYNFLAAQGLVWVFWAALAFDILLAALK